MDAALGFIKYAMPETVFSQTQQNSIIVAAEEIFVNIASYAYSPGEGDAEITVSSFSDLILYARYALYRTRNYIKTGRRATRTSGFVNL